MQLEKRMLYIIHLFIYNRHMIFLEYAKKILRKNNQKLTTTRLWLLRELGNEKKVVTPYEILHKKHETNIDITTIYRNLELFELLGLIHKISSLGWYIACNHYHECESHDLIVCKNCNKIQETHIPEETKDLLWLTQWAIELNGYCKKCEKK